MLELQELESLPTEGKRKFWFFSLSLFLLTSCPKMGYILLAYLIAWFILRSFPSSKITGRIKPIVDQKKKPIVPFRRSASLRRDCEVRDLGQRRKPKQQVPAPAPPPPRNSSSMSFAAQSNNSFLPLIQEDARMDIVEIVASAGKKPQGNFHNWV